MADTNETIADIIAEIRALSNPISDGIIAINGRIIADRLEAAWKRERGDSAKLREALIAMLDERCRQCYINDQICTQGLECHWNGKRGELCTHEAMDKAIAALAVPPRNCDRFATLPDALAAWRDVDPREAGPFDSWLFDTAKEGGAE